MEIAIAIIMAMVRFSFNLKWIHVQMYIYKLFVFSTNETQCMTIKDWLVFSTTKIDISALALCSSFNALLWNDLMCASDDDIFWLQNCLDLWQWWLMRTVSSSQSVSRMVRVTSHTLFSHNSISVTLTVLLISSPSASTALRKRSHTVLLFEP